MKKRSKFIPALLIYCFILIAIIIAGLIVLHSFLVSYEASRPDNAVKSYFQEHDRSFWTDGVQSAIAAGFNEFSDPDATISDFGLDPDAEFGWRSASGGDDTHKYYDIKLGSSTVGTITLTPDSEVGFGLCSWKVSDCLFDPGSDTTVTIGVPDSCTAYINGVEVSEEYFNGFGHTDVELDYDFDIAPQSAIYVVSGMRGPIDIRAYDELGNELDSAGVSGSQVSFLCQPEYSASFWTLPDAQVFINGTEITGQQSESTGDGLDADVCFVHYEFDGLYTHPEISVVVNGEQVSQTSLSLGSCYIPGSSVTVNDQLGSFIDKFIHAYVDFAANANRAAETNFAKLSNYILAGTEFYKTCQATIENIAWASTDDIVYNSTGCYDLMPLSNGNYVCHITYDVSYKFATTERDIQADYVVLICRDGNSYRVAAMSPEL